MGRPRHKGGASLPALHFILCMTVGMGSLLSCTGEQEKKPADTKHANAIQEQTDRAYILEQARGGDILLRKGKGLASELIVSTFAGSGGWSHCALIVSRELIDDIADHLLLPRIGFGESIEKIRSARLLVIHSVDKGLSGIGGVQIQSLEDFCSYSIRETSALYRPRIPEQERRHIQERARQLALEGMPFDRYWDSASPDKQYCSEFLWRLFEAEKLSGSKEWQFVGGIIAFTNFADPVLFEAVSQ